MRLKSFGLGIAAVFATFLLGQGAFAQGQYVGPSDLERQGGGGLLPRHQDCEETFKGSHMCSSWEIIQFGISSKATETFPGANTFLWVNPHYVPNGVSGSLLDISGVEEGSGQQATSTSLNCSGWTVVDEDQDGLVLSLLGGTFALRECESFFLQTACCE